jgi:hypothetical protein
MITNGIKRDSEILAPLKDRVLTAAAAAIGKTMSIKTSSGNIVEGPINACEPGFIKRTRTKQIQMFNVRLGLKSNGVKFEREFTISRLPV